MRINELLTHFGGVKKLSGRGHYLALCPCHDDHQPSLDIKEGNKGVVMSCPVCGADGQRVMQALGLSVGELFYEQRQSRPPKPESVEYHYSDEIKKTRFYVWDEKKRAWSKSFCWYNLLNGKWEKGKGSKPLPLYKQANIEWAKQRGKTLYIAEGEKDVDTLTEKLRLPAVCSPHGAAKGKLEGKWSPEYSKLFKDSDVAVIADNDEAGRAFAGYVAAQLLPFTKQVKLLDLNVEWDDLPEKGDITDVYESEKPTDNLSAAEHAAFRLEALASVSKPFTPDIKPEATGYIRLSDVESSATKWLWYPYIPLGKITLLTADPGTGKTFFALYLAAQVSTGKPFYGDIKQREAGIAVYQTAEDGIADTIKPRLEPMFPNFDNIYVIDESSRGLSLSDKRIEQMMEELHPSLLIFDPLQAYIGAAVDMHRANEVRPILARIGQLAERYNCAVIFIMHLSKSSQRSAMLRTYGSIDIPAVSRSMLTLVNDPDEPDGKLICHEKSSLAKHGKSIRFKISPQRGGVEFHGYSELRADDVLDNRGKQRSSAKFDDLCDDILDLFGDGDSLEIGGINELCRRLKCSTHTLYKAQKYLNIESKTAGFGKDRRTIWTLPDGFISMLPNNNAAVIP